LSQGFIHCDRS